MLGRSIKEELYRAFHGRGMYMAVIIGCLVVVAHFFIKILPVAMSYIGVLENIGYPDSVFFVTLAVETGKEVRVYYAYIFPLLAALPYAVSYYDECQNSYRNQLILRAGSRNYLIAKYIAVFITGGVAAVFPLVLDLILTMPFVPALIPQMGTFLFGVNESEWLGSLFYVHPFLYLMFRFILMFVFAGILASLPLAFTPVVAGRFTLLFLPFIFTLALESVTGFLNISYASLFFMIVYYIIGGSKMYLILLAWLLFGGAIFVIYYITGGKRYDKL